MGILAPFLQTQLLSCRKSLTLGRSLLLLLVFAAGWPLAETNLYPARVPGQQHNRRIGTAGDAAEIAAAGQEAMRNHDYASAVEKFEKLERMAPGTAEIHANLATAYYFMGRYEDAVREGHTTLKLKPSLTTTHLFLGLSLAESGRCPEALPFLEQDYPRAPEPQVKRAVGTDGLRCAMSSNNIDKAVGFARSLNRDFPDDPDLLYLSSHLYSDLSTQTSQRLLMTAPGSYQAHQLNAEVLALQGKVSDAREEYQKVLGLNPHLAGIHYELGRLLLAGEPGANALNDARQEFELELKVDPGNATAQYELGEIARQAREWDDAILHFESAAKLEPRFVDALIGLGKSLISAGRVSEAVARLERAVELQPENPNAHYQLSFAYRRVGREQEASRELAAYRESHERAMQTRQRIRAGILGTIAQPQNDSPPE